MTFARIFSAALAIFFLSLPVLPGQQYFAVDPREHLAEGEEWSERSGARNLDLPRVVIEGSEGYLVSGAGTLEDPFRPSLGDGRVPHLMIRVPQGAAAKGRIFLPSVSHSGVRQLAFEVPATATSKKARVEFLKARDAYDRHLFQQGVTGAAFYRHRLNATREELGEESLPAIRPPRRRRNGSNELEESLDLFSGGRALSENLQLDRELALRDNPVDKEAKFIPIEKIEGVTTEGIDWKPFIEGRTPKLDHLATAIPHDQHVLLFPSFRAMEKMADQGQASGAGLFQLITQRIEDAAVRERYEKQLCLRLNRVFRMTGPAVIRSVAMTGSDPYLRTGSDVAILFHTPDPDGLAKILQAFQNAEAKKYGAEYEVFGSVGDSDFEASGYATRDRSVSSFISVLSEDILAISNSATQLRLLHDAAQGKTTSLDELDEFTFFRDRYPLGAEEETALAVLSDATIRRWCSPRWRIGASRRTRVAAVLSELQARIITDPGTKLGKDLPRPVEGMGRYRREGDSVFVGTYGGLDFLTPIRELPIKKVSPAERRAYDAFRAGYQRNWTNGFDPIAVRFTIDDDQLAFDLTVRPLIGFSEYNEWITLVGGGEIKEGEGDPHEDSLVHFVMGIDPKSDQFRGIDSLLGGLGPNPLGWLGDWVSLAVDQDPVWGELAEKVGDGGFSALGDELEGDPDPPVVFMADVSNPFRLLGFLTAARAFVEASGPGMTLWTNHLHDGMPYVKISSTDEQDWAGLEEIALHYASYDRKLIISLSESSLQQTLARLKVKKTARAEAKANAEEEGEESGVDEEKIASPSWGGRHLAIHARELGFLERLSQSTYHAALERRSWAHLPILSEWKRMFPMEDPVAVHERYWKVRPVCPAGGEYRWNEEDQCMESSVLGHPGRRASDPKLPLLSEGIEDLALGITFEENGLRATGRVHFETEGEAKP